jgi:hypothetical protein
MGSGAPHEHQTAPACEGGTINLVPQSPHS